MSNSKFLLFVFLGVVFWFNGVLTVRFLGPTLLTSNNPNLIWAYALVIPITVLTLVITRFVGQTPYHQLLKPIVIMTYTATICDGIALSWFRSLYSSSIDIALHGAALILWGGGLGLLFAHILELMHTRSKQISQ